MNEYQKAVREFMLAVNQDSPEKPTIDNYPFELRAKLILEEAHEFVRACGLGVAIGSSPRGHESFVSTVCPRHQENWPEMIDALCDILVVTYGAANSMGIDLDAFFAEVHRSNMAKLGGPVREDGKRLKPPGWTPPDIKGLLKKALEEK